MNSLIDTGSTNYMNATLQCLLHVSDFILYFINEFPEDQGKLFYINKDVQDISKAFVNLVMDVCGINNLSNRGKKIYPEAIKKTFDNYSNKHPFSPDDFYSPQFRNNNFEANAPKNLILYLFQTMHEEMKYFKNEKLRLELIPNEYKKFEAYQEFKQ